MRKTQLPAGPPLPSLFQLYRWVKSPTEFFRSCGEQFGSGFTIRLPGLPPFVFFYRPEEVRWIATAPKDQALGGAVNAFLEPIVGQDSLLLLEGTPHASRRHALMKPLRAESMSAYRNAISSITKRVLEKVPEGKPTSGIEITRNITFEVILNVIFGLDSGHLHDLVSHLGQEVMKTLGTPWLLFPMFQRNLGAWSPWGRFCRQRDRLHAALSEVIQARRRDRRTLDHERPDILSQLLTATDEDGHLLSDESIRSELITMLLAGHETTAHALSWALLELAKHQDMQERARVSVKSSENSSLDDASSDFSDDSSDDAYIDALVRETLRMHPVVAGVGRKLVRPTTIATTELPAGAVAVASVYLVQHDAAHWSDPYRFRPDRFLKRKPPPYAWIPFGLGGRRCIGMSLALFEMRVVIESILAERKILAVEGYEPRTVRSSVALSASGGAPILLTRRS
ncbi:MAG: cytochrome P450 [Myxococcota bacterium]